MIRIVGNTFYNWTNKSLMKIPEFKRSGIGLITEFCGIPNGFPNQGLPPILLFFKICHAQLQVQSS
jgi:hypothetical protein